MWRVSLTLSMTWMWLSHAPGGNLNSCIAGGIDVSRGNVRWNVAGRRGSSTRNKGNRWSVSQVVCRFLRPLRIPSTQMREGDRESHVSRSCLPLSPFPGISNWSRRRKSIWADSSAGTAINDIDSDCQTWGLVDPRTTRVGERQKCLRFPSDDWRTVSMVL